MLLSLTLTILVFFWNTTSFGAKAGYSNEDRLKVLEAHIDLVTYRDALYLEYITLLNNTGQYEKALDCLTTHQFHPWEGGEGKVSAQYRYALTQKALLLLNKKQYDEAIELLEATKTYPQNLGEGKLPNVQDNIADYYLGIAYEETGAKEIANKYYLAASVGLDEPGSVLYYNDQPSDTILYQGFANEKLGNTNAARKCYTSFFPSAKSTCSTKLDMITLQYRFRKLKCSQAIFKIETILIATT